jgi:ubiquinone/menaquinone biosynthesis C-methylase UbiE
MQSQTIASETPAPTKGLVIRWASRYDAVVSLLTLGRSRRLRMATLDQARLVPGESLLDVGCGTGGVTIPARERLGPDGKAAGIDPSAEMIAVARQKAARKQLEIAFHVGAIESLPYTEASFDVVTASLMMHHLPREVQVRGLAEIHRVLKPGGRLLIVDALQPTRFPMKQIFAHLAHRHGIQFGVADLPAVLLSAGFSSAELLNERFLTLGFVRGVKAVNVPVGRADR